MIPLANPIAAPSLDEIRAEKIRLDAIIAEAEKAERERLRHEAEVAKNMSRVGRHVESYQRQKTLLLSIAAAVKSAGGGELVVSASSFAALPSENEVEAYLVSEVIAKGYCYAIALHINEATESAGHAHISLYNGKVEICGTGSRARIYRAGSKGFNIAGIAAAYIELKSSSANQLAIKQREAGKMETARANVRSMVGSAPAPSDNGVAAGLRVTLAPSTWGDRICVSINASVSEEKATELLAALAALGFVPSF